MMQFPDESARDAADEEKEMAFFRPWAEAMVQAELSRAAFDQMWERIKIKLDDLHRIEDLIADVWPNSEMVDK